jgi:hypothetical protein
MAFFPKQRVEVAMRRKLAYLIVVGAVLLSSCASGPTPPDWQGSVLGATERATEAYLTGRPRIEQVEFNRARSDIARTGRADLIGRVELVRCATRVASLVLEACEGFDKVAADAGQAERSYAAYLSGQARPEDAAHLPAAHRDVIKGGARAIQAMANPLSKLVAAGVLFRMSLADPAVIALATETASAQGWNRPLLAWLSVQMKRAELAGDSAEVARIQRRIGLVLPTSTR